MNINLYDEKAIRISNALLNRVNFLNVDNTISANKVTIPSTDDFLIDLYIYRPKNIDRELPCMVYYHGGGFFLKGDALSPKILSEYIKENSMVIVYVDYRLSIDFPYPTPVNDCYAGLNWVYNNYEFLNIKQDKIFVMGFSAGGALAAGVTLRARDNNLDIIKAQILICPVTDHRQVTDSVKNFVDTPNWTSKRNRHMWELYLRDITGDVPYYASPLNAPDFKNLPPAYVELSQFDPLHDEGLLYANKLKESGIHVVLNDTKGTVHMSSIVLRAKKTMDNIKKMSEFIRESLNE
ncbi:alpha/beta hydrolase [Thiospirochaeta perfilievii]|uniref:Alpha/beta hydrolase n=1 Tax=Thiospirochaeta perfilievii TaxID=252967 RepID=A0A5C1QBX3_9SPIO|nr:alpha/beta hydrolase [Thiospirochaeta perfilievii]QEN03702.1 alpha/beta hydrolase [Thiospirochaeta perfilievii]